MKATIISVAQAIEDGNYKWNQGENDIEYKGWIPGYCVGVCMEIKRHDGSIGYSSCTFIDREEFLDEIKIDDTSLDPLAIMADCCSHNGVPTGRLIFRGYFEEEWIPEEREYGYLDASKEVAEMFNKYVIA